MYEKIVESSRFCAMGYNGACDGCIFCGKSNDKDGECYQQLHKAAADAIEGLSGLVDRYGGETGIKNLQEYANKYWDLLKNAPRWFSVTERLPELDKRVFVIGLFGFCGIYSLIQVHDTTCWEDEYGYYQDFEDVTHWMPLPEPPKEEI